MAEGNKNITAEPPRVSLAAKFASRYGVEPNKMLDTLKVTAFRQKGHNAAQITNEQMIALLIVADQYHLNPFTREIYAFPQDGGIVPIVGVDGWARMMNEHPQFDGIEFTNIGDLMSETGGSQHNPCPDGIECIVYRKDRQHATRVTEYLEDCYQPPRNGYSGPWQSHTRRMLRHKAMIQAARIAFGFVGIYDEDEGMRIIEAETSPAEPSQPITQSVRRKSEAAEDIADAEISEPPPKQAKADTTPPKEEAPPVAEDAPAAPGEPVDESSTYTVQYLIELVDESNTDADFKYIEGKAQAHHKGADLKAISAAVGARRNVLKDGKKT